MMKAESAGGVIVNELNEVVIVFTNNKSWQFPKGEVEKGESYIQTAIREIREETGLTDIKLIKKLPMYNRVRGNVSRDIHYFLFKTKKQELRPSMEVSVCEWVSIEKAEEKITYEEDKEFFRKIRKEIKQIK